MGCKRVRTRTVAEGPESQADSTAILVCGIKGMFEGVKELAADAGIDEAKVMANF